MQLEELEEIKVVIDIGTYSSSLTSYLLWVKTRPLGEVKTDGFYVEDNFEFENGFMNQYKFLILRSICKSRLPQFVALNMCVFRAIGAIEVMCKNLYYF